MNRDPELIKAVNYIANYCRQHICTECPLNITGESETILKAHCVCDYNVLHLPSTWRTEELRHEHTEN